MIDDITVREAQSQVDEWIKTIGIRYFNELTNLGILMEETGELARIMVRKYGEQSYKSGHASADEFRELGDEIADIFWVLLCIANQTGVSVTESFKANMEKKTLRDKSRHAQNEKLKN